MGHDKLASPKLLPKNSSYASFLVANRQFLQFLILFTENSNKKNLSTFFLQNR